VIEYLCGVDLHCESGDVFLGNVEGEDEGVEAECSSAA
jgi:hypothetical protein